MPRENISQDFKINAEENCGVESRAVEPDWDHFESAGFLHEPQSIHHQSEQFNTSKICFKVKSMFHKSLSLSSLPLQ